LRLLLPFLLLAAPAQAADLLHRPKVHVAVGMAASIDRNAPNPRPGDPIAAFLFTLGVGDGFLGLDLRSCANGATQMQLSRLSGELVGVFRPLVLARMDRPGYGYRVLRTASLDLGAGVERVSLSLQSDWRAGLVVGGHIDLPVGPAASKELRLRLGVRRLVATEGTIARLPARDTTMEVYGQAAFVF